MCAVSRNISKQGECERKKESEKVAEVSAKRKKVKPEECRSISKHLSTWKKQIVKIFMSLVLDPLLLVNIHYKVEGSSSFCFKDDLFSAKIESIGRRLDS